MPRPLCQVHQSGGSQSDKADGCDAMQKPVAKPATSLLGGPVHLGEDSPMSKAHRTYLMVAFTIAVGLAITFGVSLGVGLGLGLSRGALQTATCHTRFCTTVPALAQQGLRQRWPEL